MIAVIGNGNWSAPISPLFTGPIPLREPPDPHPSPKVETICSMMKSPRCRTVLRRFLTSVDTVEADHLLFITNGQPSAAGLAAVHDHYHPDMPALDHDEFFIFNKELVFDPDLYREDHFPFAATLDNARIINRVQNKLEARLGASSRIKSMPHNIDLEVTARCNLSCPICGWRLQFHSRDTLDMHPGLLDQGGDVLEKVWSIRLQGAGEPFCTDHFWDFYDQANRRGINTQLFTNGTLLDDRGIDRLLDGSVYHITVSLDGVTPGAVEATRGQDCFETVRRNLFALARRRGRSAVPRIDINFVGLRRNIEELPALIDLAAEAGVDGVTLQMLVVHYRALIPQSLYHHQRLANRMIRRAARRAERQGIEFCAPGLFSPLDRIRGNGTCRHSACRQAWQNAVVQYDGTVYPCCITREGGLGRLGGGGIIWRDLERGTLP